MCPTFSPLYVMEDQVELAEQKMSISWHKVGKTSFNQKKKTSLMKKGAA